MTSYWACAVFTAISATVSLMYSIASVRAHNDGVVLTARYGLVRSIALCAVAVVPLLEEREEWLVCAAVAMIAVQAGDAMVGVTLRDRFKTVGPAITSAVNLGLLIWALEA